MNDRCCECVTMKARILQVCPCWLLVCDLCNEQRVLVHTNSACGFCPGDCVCIWYDGVMTASEPPQITADRICPLNTCC